MKQLIAAFALVGVLSALTPAWAGMTSARYQIEWDAFSQGGLDIGASEQYQLRDSLGGTFGAEMGADGKSLLDGYRAGIYDPIFSFSLGVQDASSRKNVTSVSGSVVMLPNTTTYAAGDIVLLLQDDSAAQGYRVGKIGSIAPNTSITILGDWTTVGTTPVIDGSNDTLYKVVTGSVAQLGELSQSKVATSVIAVNVISEGLNGYVVQMLGQTALTSGSHGLTGVADGSVTAGAEEYGGRSSDETLADSLFDTQDTAITDSFQTIASENNPVYGKSTFLTLKASRSSTTPSGTYGQTLTIIASGTY